MVRIKEWSNRIARASSRAERIVSRGGRKLEQEEVCVAGHIVPIERDGGGASDEDVPTSVGRNAVVPAVNHGARRTGPIVLHRPSYTNEGVSLPISFADLDARVVELEEQKV